VNVMPALPSTVSAPASASEGSARRCLKKLRAECWREPGSAREPCRFGEHSRGEHVTDSVAWRERRLIFNDRPSGR